MVSTNQRKGELKNLSNFESNKNLQNFESNKKSAKFAEAAAFRRQWEN